MAMERVEAWSFKYFGKLQTYFDANATIKTSSMVLLAFGNIFCLVWFHLGGRRTAKASIKHKMKTTLESSLSDNALAKFF